MSSTAAVSEDNARLSLDRKGGEERRKSRKGAGAATTPDHRMLCELGNWGGFVYN